MTSAEIRALARLLDRMDYYRLLRVEREAPLPAIRSAYHRARRQFHPDSYLRSESELHEAVDRIARRITEAYLVLRTSERRAAYDKSLAEGKLRYSPESEEDAGGGFGGLRARNPNARRFVSLALAEERSGNLSKAVSHLKMALTFDRDNESLQEKLESLQARLKN